MTPPRARSTARKILIAVIVLYAVGWGVVGVVSVVRESARQERQSVVQTCEFLQRSRADFEAPNPGPTTRDERVELSEIDEELTANGC